MTETPDVAEGAVHFFKGSSTPPDLYTYIPEEFYKQVSFKEIVAMSASGIILLKADVLEGEPGVYKSRYVILDNDKVLVAAIGDKVPTQIANNKALAFKDGGDAFFSAPVEMIWESQVGYENVEDNKKVIRAGTSPGKQWMQGKGSRIFPDKKSVGDQTPNRNRLFLHIKTIADLTPNNQVFLKAFDVDDATPDSVDNDPAHNNQLAYKVDDNGPGGDDNKDEVWLPRTGKFVSSNLGIAPCR